MTPPVPVTILPGPPGLGPPRRPARRRFGGYRRPGPGRGRGERGVLLRRR
ncbi:hypothetical protein LUX05_08140 [Streptomyces somaliensis]|nr:hypothetical protein [Streptomyces somaliensis]